MFNIILLSTLAIISKSMITSHQRCGTTYIFEPAIEACCNNERKYNFAIQSCCNGIVFDSPSCARTTPDKPLPKEQLPNGPKLIIRSDYIKPVDADVAEVDTGDETDTVDDATQDDGNTEGDTADDGNTDGTDDTGTDDDNEDDVDAENDEDNDDNDNDDDADNDDIDDDNDDDAFVEGSGDEESTDGGSAEPGTETDTGSNVDDVDEDGALYNQNGGLESGNSNAKNSNNFNDMDYYVKITLINMWLILGLIVIVNIVFYWCYCRKQNRRNKLNRIQSSHMYVDEHITQGQLTDDNDDNV